MNEKTSTAQFPLKSPPPEAVARPTPTNDGGPAFPQGHLDGPHVDPSGMSVRQYYKGQALAGLLGNCDYTAAFNLYDAKMRSSVALECGSMADDMLAEDAAFAERAKGEKP